MTSRRWLGVVGILTLATGGVPAAALADTDGGRGAPSGPETEIVAVEDANGALHGRTVRSALPEHPAGVGDTALDVERVTEQVPQLPGWPVQIASNRFYHPQR